MRDAANSSKIYFNTKPAGEYHKLSTSSADEYVSPTGAVVPPKLPHLDPGLMQPHGNELHNGASQNVEIQRCGGLKNRRTENMKDWKREVTL